MMPYMNTECMSLVILENRVEILYSYWKNPPEHLNTLKGLHTHGYPEVHYSIDKVKTFMIENESVQINPGEALIIKPDILHNPSNHEGSGKSFNYNIHERKNGLEVLIPEGKYQIIRDVNVSYIQSIQDEYQSHQPGYQEKLRMLFQLCLIDLAQHADNRIQSIPEPMSYHQYGMLIERYITTQISDASLVPELAGSKEKLAQDLHLSLRQLERIVKSVFGMSYSELYNKHKFTLATRLLRDMNMKVKDVSLFLGYSDEANFSRAFINYYGFSPAKLSLYEIINNN